MFSLFKFLLLSSVTLRSETISDMNSNYTGKNIVGHGLFKGSWKSPFIWKDIPLFLIRRWSLYRLIVYLQKNPPTFEKCPFKAAIFMTLCRGIATEILQQSEKTHGQFSFKADFDHVRTNTSKIWSKIRFMKNISDI